MAALMQNGVSQAVDVLVYNDKLLLGVSAAAEGGGHIRQAIDAQGEANVVLATGASQFEMLGCSGPRGDRLVARNRVPSDEYVGLPASHLASFRKYLRERLLAQLPVKPRFVEVNGDALDPLAETARLGALIEQHPIDVCFAGIGENGHLAFNDPPADFETEQPYLIVSLDDACRRQQLGEGWFDSFEAVPRQAISMGIKQILKSRQIVLSVPDARKAEAVAASVEGPVTPMCPASILQRHPRATLHLDLASSAGLRR
ncbi:MAG: glucosamine-6-phosphate deaminase [Devosia sp.]|nr:glucosamine-6-phosphate deaminase [Devosia sp.]